MIDRHAKRNAEIRLRHRQHGNSERMLARFYDLPVDEIRSILHVPLINMVKQGSDDQPREAFSDSVLESPDWQAALDQSINELIEWVLRLHKIERTQLGKPFDGNALEARRTLTFNLRRRWGLHIKDVASLIGVTPVTARRFDGECRNRQKPPIEPPEPILPEVYRVELRNVAKALDVTPLAVFHGQADLLQRARRVFLQRMFWQHKIDICDIAKATGFFRSRIHKQVHHRRAG
ncbi:hypothetical protein SAMN04515647_3690 [Cohaesibacter sp. ES.047]|uniref:hypothetical protein n=1 Tax=Cohaesibacter sp. ES.047 TaxID=1798205 RepID=UPI000BB7ED22|nr:hypothetical protein [Cohaesibacter sp. ES.047]SNY93395.1 hypothetical protein SAMN04515647_3690 [Cohaesibacter sp. ES.047]